MQVFEGMSGCRSASPFCFELSPLRKSDWYRFELLGILGWRSKQGRRGLGKVCPGSNHNGGAGTLLPSPYYLTLSRRLP